MSDYDILFLSLFPSLSLSLSLSRACSRSLSLSLSLSRVFAMDKPGRGRYHEMNKILRYVNNTKKLGDISTEN